MPLRLNNLIGFGAGGPRIIMISVSSSTNDYVLYDVLSAAGHAPGSQTKAGGRTIIQVTLSNAVIIGSTSTSTAGFRTHDGDTYGAGWDEADCQIIVGGTNTATIQGKGGVGGDGAEGIEGLGGESGGGGGGGAGTQVGAGGTGGINADNGSPGTATAGGAGGAGDAESGDEVVVATAGANGGIALEASSGGPNITLRPASGATLNVWGGGGGGGGGGQGESGATGGNPGLDGGTGANGGGAGGTHGAAYSTPGSATITETGPGTIDDRGA